MMVVLSHGRGADAPRQISETVLPDFRRGGPFSFLANSGTRKAWTPDRLFEKKGITDFGNLRYVSLNLTSENFDDVLAAIEAWNEARFAVMIKFPRLARRPAVGTKDDNKFFGLDVEDCYLLGDNGGWEASDLLKERIAGCFRDDTLVTVEL